MLDLSVAGMQYAQRRLGPRAKQVRWLTVDVLTWQPERVPGLARPGGLPFPDHLPAAAGVHATLGAATDTGAVAVIGCFAPDGPERCSGLLVARYSPAQLADELGGQWRLIGEDRQEHSTPAGLIQPFTWVALRKQA